MIPRKHYETNGTSTKKTSYAKQMSNHYQSHGRDIGQQPPC